MKLFNFVDPGARAPRLGVVTEAGLVSLGAAARASGEALPATLEALLEGGDAALDRVRRFVERLPAEGDTPGLLGRGDLAFAPCVAHPEKILCVGLNYHRHAVESGLAVPDVPVLFSKFNNSLAAANEPIPLPARASEFDYEVELGVVIGRRARYVSEGEALDYVLGYCTLNDLSVRDLQRRTSQWLLGKTPDKFMPAGPYLVTADEVGDPQQLGLYCWVNGEARQHSTTADMIFSVAAVISYVSQFMTLKPGDLLSTGTPEGVVLGMANKVWLKPGDAVTVEVEKLGRLTNIMTAE